MYEPENSNFWYKFFLVHNPWKLVCGLSSLKHRHPTTVATSIWQEPEWHTQLGGRYPTLRIIVLLRCELSSLGFYGRILEELWNFKHI